MTDIQSGPKDRFFIRAVFFVQPLLLGAWFPRIAELQQKLDLGPADLSWALIGMPIGLLISLIFAGRLADRVGAKPLLLVSLLGFFVAMPFVPTAQSQWGLFYFLMMGGVFMAAVELAMNVMADRIERYGDRLIMAGCHGFWSLGVLAGGAVSTIFAHQGIGPFASLLTIALVMVVPALYAATGLRELPAIETKAKTRHPSTRPGWPVFAVCLFTGGIALAEGAMADWAAVYLTDVFNASPAAAGSGYLIFAFAIAFGRFNGDWIRQRFDTVRAARLFVLTALIGLALLVFAGNRSVASLGFGLVGLGLSSGFPLGVSVVSGRPGRSSAANVGLLSQIALAGFLISPPLIGLVAESHGLRVGLATVAIALCISLVMTRELRDRPAQTALKT
ncbi:MFS transporter [Qingshengfaniella alkalisoli]|nr:MFS transporter [Qingshengfaniella alkalisoli]